MDPLQFDYPFYTPFQYAGNKPISNIDLDGLEEWYFMKEIHKGIGVWQKSNVVSGPLSEEKLNSLGYYNRSQLSSMHKQYWAQQHRKKESAKRVELHKFKQYLNMDQTRPENNPVFGALQAIYSMTLETPVASINDFSKGDYASGTFNAAMTVLSILEVAAFAKLATGGAATYKSAKYIDDVVKKQKVSISEYKKVVSETIEECGDDLLEAGVDATSRVGSRITSGSSNIKNLKIIGHEDDFFQITGKFDGIDIEIQGMMRIEGDNLIMESVDFGGAIGVGNMRQLVNEFGRHTGVKQVAIFPGKRTTGANPGKTPKPFTINIE